MNIVDGIDLRGVVVGVFLVVVLVLAVIVLAWAYDTYQQKADARWVERHFKERQSKTS